ncbi:MAG: TolC family protein [Pseudomonadales bacterium]
MPVNAKQVVSLQQVLGSASERYPKILEAKEKLRQAQAVRLAAEGAFDIELTQNTRVRTSGYYDGAYANQKIIKPLANANAKVFAEYRLSTGEFPVYEDEFVTLDRGEVSLGLSFSLLRNREIDPYRLAIANADLDISMETFRQQAVLNNVLFDAAIAYMEWLNAFEQLTVFQQLFENARERQTAINNRVKLGLSARIDLLDNEQNLLKRKAAVLKAQNELDLRGIALSLYWRDNSGKPLPIGPSLRPSLPRELSNSAIADMDQLVSDAIALHPDIRYVDNLIKKTKNNRQLYENELLPTVDIHLKAGHDLGDGSNTREGLESYAGIEFSMPLGQSRAKGKRNQANAKLKELGYLHQRLTENLSGLLQQAKAKYVNAKAQARITSRRSDIAQKLLEQEQQRFTQGASDVFLINIREENTSEARIDAITAELQGVMAGIELLGGAYQMNKMLRNSTRESSVVN